MGRRKSVCKMATCINVSIEDENVKFQLNSKENLLCSNKQKEIFLSNVVQILYRKQKEAQAKMKPEIEETVKAHKMVSVFQQFALEDNWDYENQEEMFDFNDYFSFLDQ